MRDIREASAQARTTVQELRTLLVDLYPPNLRTEGLEHAFADLATPLRARGTVVDITNRLERRPSEGAVNEAIATANANPSDAERAFSTRRAP